MFVLINSTGFLNEPFHIDLMHRSNFTLYMCILSVCAAPGAGEGTSSGGDPTHPPRKKRARVDPTVESVSSQMISG